MGELNSIKPRLSPQEVPQFSQYAARSLNAMALQCGSTPQDLIERFETISDSPIMATSKYMIICFPDTMR